MHAKVFQITKQRVDNENTLNENTLTQGDGSFYDSHKAMAVSMTTVPRLLQSSGRR